MSVTRFNKPIEWAYKLDKKKLLKPLSSINLKKFSNNIKVNYCEAGMFVVYQFDFMKKKKLIYKPFVLPLYQSVDIDDMEDFNLAKNLYKKYDRGILDLKCKICKNKIFRFITPPLQDISGQDRKNIYTQ